MSERILCVISGFPASGKTTLLNGAIAERIPLFGEWSTHLFSLQRWRPDFASLSGLERMAVTPVEYRWISADIAVEGARFPTQGVLHMDLSVASDLEYFPYPAYRDRLFLMERFEARLGRLFERYDKVICNAIAIELDSVIERYIERCRRKSGRVYWRYDNLKTLYGRRDVATYDAISDAWSAFVRERSFQMFETRWGKNFAVQVSKVT
jgi:hypothetical protein